MFDGLLVHKIDESVGNMQLRGALSNLVSEPGMPKVYMMAFSNSCFVQARKYRDWLNV